MKSLILFIGFAVVLSSCGIKELAEETRDEVKKTNTEVTKTNEAVERTNEGVTKTYQSVDELEAKMDLLHKETQRLLALIVELNRGMAKTNAAVHLQTLTIALQQLVSAETTESLEVPVRMFPYAETFAREASAHELLQTFHVFLKDATLGYADGEKPNEKDLRIRGRMISLIGASLMATFAPEEKVEEILTDEIEKKGRFQDTAYAFALLRYEGTQNYLLGSVLKTQTVNVETLKTAVEHYRIMKTIAEKPYVAELKLNVPKLIAVRNDAGTATAFQDVDKALDPSDTLAKGRSAKRFFLAKLSKEITSQEKIQALLAELAP
jgi:hypothetical protein